MFSGRPARGRRPATASECVDHLITILCKNLEPPLISLYFASKEFQFSMFSEGLSKCFFGYWLLVSLFSVESLYLTRGMLSCFFVCLLSHQTRTYESFKHENQLKHTHNRTFRKEPAINFICYKKYNLFPFFFKLNLLKMPTITQCDRDKIIFLTWWSPNSW